MAALICPFAAECGGCDSQEVPYAEQVARKDASLRALFGDDGTWLPFIAMPGEHPAYYRNKIRFSFVRQDGRVMPSRHGKDGSEIPVDRCLLQSPLCENLVMWTAGFAECHGWDLGWFKHVMLREGKRTGEAMVGLVTDQGSIPDEEAWLDGLQARYPQVVSAYHMTTWGRNNERIEDRLLWGAPHIHESVGSYRFRISPHAFFQTNGEMVETLYRAAGEAAALAPADTLWDLYAGSATIGIFLSGAAGEVVSVENNPQNIADARANLELNGVKNLRLVDGPVEGFDAARPDVIVVDPPRAGLSEASRELIARARPARLVYVSCNPLTCARDILDLARRGFSVVSRQGIDMFPHTHHCETVTVLRPS